MQVTSLTMWLCSRFFMVEYHHRVWLMSMQAEWSTLISQLRYPASESTPNYLDHLGPPQVPIGN